MAIVGIVTLRTEDEVPAEVLEVDVERVLPAAVLRSIVTLLCVPLLPSGAPSPGSDRQEGLMAEVRT